MDFENLNCQVGGSSASSSDDEVCATQEVDYNSVDRVLGRQPVGVRLSQLSSYSAAGEGSARRGGSRRVQPGRGGGGAISRQGGARMRIVTNDGPSPTFPNRRRSGRFSSVEAWGAPNGSVVDITCEDPPSDGTGVGFSDFASTPVHVPQAMPREQGMRKTLKRRRNGNWYDEQLSSAIAAFDSGMSMEKASEQFHIPYSSFREHCYGMRKSRRRGAKGVLLDDEDRQLVEWLISMVERGFGLTPTALKMKVCEITMSRDIPFREGIPGGGWMRGWRRWHPELTLQVSQALEIARARGLCKDNIKSFCDNLRALYDQHNYTPDRIWNCDESGAQAGKNGGGGCDCKDGGTKGSFRCPRPAGVVISPCMHKCSWTCHPLFLHLQGKKIWTELH
jgi:hypothetical protein